MNAVDELTAVAERDGALPLPALTQAELCALGAASASVVCQRTWDWWTGLGDQGREDLTAKALGLLAHRSLIVPSAGDVPGVPVPELGLILAARTQPEPVVICQVEGRDAAFEPRFFGLAQEDGSIRGLICEILTGQPSGPGDRSDFGTMISYTLVTPRRAAEVIHAWARAALRHDGTARPVADVFGHLEDGQPCRDRFELHTAGRFDEMLLLDALTRTGQ